MKKFLLFAAITFSAMQLSAAIKHEYGNWQITLDDASKLSISFSGRELFADVRAESTYNVVGHSSETTLKTGGGSAVELASEPLDDAFGKGECLILRSQADDAVFEQLFRFYDSRPYMLVSARVRSKSADRVESRRILPLIVKGSTYPFSCTNPRKIFVPFDNNSHSTRYRSVDFATQSLTSSEVSAMFDPETRQGFVLGSVDHDKWKSSVSISTRSGGRLASLEILSGFTDANLTKDGIAHGKVRGTEVESARFMVGGFDDWREGFNTFGDACNVVAPRWEWTKGNPVGWNSWGNMLNYINYQGVVETATFMKENLWSKGFHDREGKIAISLDSFGSGNIGDANMYYMGTKLFCDGTYRDGRETKQGMNMTLGEYGGLVVWGWTVDSKIPGTGLNGTPDYKWGDVMLKANGVPYTHNPEQGAYAIDPTHPAVRANMEYSFRRWNSFGVKYVKMDFLDSAIREGDSWYDPEVTTGTMAYNYGMAIVRELAEKYGMYVVEAMSPLFPYQYAHGRRTCCDRWGSLEESEFVMNAISYGWWTSKLYTVNDPDQMTLFPNGSNASLTEGVNRARATSGMTTGAFIFGDNFSDNCFYTDDKDGHTKGQVVGYPRQARERALTIMGNPDINEYVRNNTGSFMPLDGNNPSSRQESESIFVRDTPQYFYVAVFNWKSLLASKGSIAFSRLGLDAANIADVKELWLNEPVNLTATALNYDLPGGDVRVYRFTKKDYNGGAPDGIELPEADAAPGVAVNSANGCLTVTSESEIERMTVTDLAGRLCEAITVNGCAATSAPLASGIYLLNLTMANGTPASVKAVVK